jgi:hypothetical protein
VQRPPGRRLVVSCCLPAVPAVGMAMMAMFVGYVSIILDHGCSFPCSTTK